MNNIKRGTLANILVLHDFKKEPMDGKGWFYFVEGWLLKSGLVPTKMSGKGTKTITFTRGKKQQEREDFKDLSKGMWIAALPLNPGTEMFDFLFSAHLSCYKEKGTSVLCWDDQIISFEKKYLEILVKDLLAYLKPAYGYGYQKEFRYGPAFHPFGMLGGDDLPRDEERRISKWGQVYGRMNTSYHTGMFRDIYPLNFLSSPHFDIRIEGQPLADWIKAHPNHGELEQLLPGFWSWWIPKESLESVRQAFILNNLLIAYQ